MESINIYPNMPALSWCSAQKYIIYINNKSWWILLFRWKKKYCNCDKLCWRQSCTADQPSAAARGCDRLTRATTEVTSTTSWTQEIKNCKNWPFINISIRSAPVLAIKSIKKISSYQTSLPYFGVKLSCVCIMFAK